MGDVQPFNVRESVAVLTRSWKLLTLFIASAMLSALAYTYIFSERYAATTTLLYRPNKEVRFEGVAQPQSTLGFPIPAIYPFEALGLTIKQIGTSERILRPVVEELGLDQPDTTVRTGIAKYYHDTKEAIKEFGKNTWQILKYGRLIEENRTSGAMVQLAASTTIDTAQKNYAATITVLDKDPVRAAEIVDSIGEQLIKFMRELSMKGAHEKGQELDVHMGEMKAEINRTRTAIQSLKVANTYVDLPAEMALRLKTAEQLELELLKNNSDLEAARAKLTALVQQREALSPMLKGSETIADDPVYSHLRELEATSEVELQGLLARSHSDHPDVRSAQARIRTTKELLHGATPTHISQVAMELSKVYQTMHGEELKARAEVAGLEATHQSLTTSLERARDRVPKPSLEAEHNALQLQLSVLESDYKKLATLREEVRDAELTTKAEVYLLHRATPQDYPTRPIKVYHVLLSGLLALILGVGVIYLIDYGRWLLATSGPTPETPYAR